MQKNSQRGTPLEGFEKKSWGIKGTFGKISTPLLPFKIRRLELYDLYMQMLFPMSGQGLRIKNAGWALPKPLIPVSGQPMIERLLQKIPMECPCTFVLAENHQTTNLKTYLNLRSPILVSYCDYGLKWV